VIYWRIGIEFTERASEIVLHDGCLTPTADSDPPCPVHLQTKEIRTRSHVTGAMPDADNTDINPSVCVCVCVFVCVCVHFKCSNGS